MGDLYLCFECEDCVWCEGTFDPADVEDGGWVECPCCGSLDVEEQL